MFIFALVLMLLCTPAYSGGPVAPGPPTSVRVTTPSGPVNNRVIGPLGTVSAQGLGKSPVYSAEKQAYHGSGYINAEMEHNSNKPVMPDCGPAFREYNRTFDKWEEYNSKLVEWRVEGVRLREQYNAPNGFNKNK